MNEQAAREMPQYRCHKEVYALKIAKIDYSDIRWDIPGALTYVAIISPAEEGYAPFEVDADWVRQYNPQVGGYYIVTGAGYKSYAPGESFEADFALIK